DHPFVAPPSEREIISFINELGYPGTLTRISDIATNSLYQPWRAFMTMINRCLTGKASRFDRPRLSLLEILWGIVTMSNSLGNDHRKVNDRKQLLLPFPRFKKLIVKHLFSLKDHISRRSSSFQHVIKLDTTMGNLKFINKGAKDPIFRNANSNGNP
ncbi:hypothetical protein Tco_0334037, partial [Tanacetum coccineum]